MPLRPDEPASPVSSPALWQAASEPVTNKGNNSNASQRLICLFISIVLVKK
jgi:hypothetical protein